MPILPIGVKLHFYGFDSPTEMTGSDSPSQVLHFVLDYLASIDSASGQEHRERIDPLLGQDSNWENPAALADPAKSVGLSPAATALRIETEDLITELRARRPELVAKSDESRYLEAAAVCFGGTAVTELSCRVGAKVGRTVCRTSRHSRRVDGG